MIDKEKFQKVLNGKSTPIRSKLIFLLLEKGLMIKDITSLSSKDLQVIKDLENGELLFQKYVSQKGVMNSIVKNNLIFPSSEGGELTEEGILTTLRRNCRVYGFQLQDLGFEGARRAKAGDSFRTMSLDDIQKYIEEQHKKTK